MSFLPIMMREAICKQIINNKFMGAATRAINLVSDCLCCYEFNYNNSCGTPNEVNPEDIIEIFSNYSSLPWDDFKNIIGIKGCSCNQEGFLGSYSNLDNYGSLIIYLKYLYLKVMEGKEVVCIDNGTDDDRISDSFLLMNDGILYSISFKVDKNIKNCNFVNTAIAAYNATHSEVAEEYYNKLETYYSIAESFYVENYMDL